jgi:hypothetical protein
VNPLGYVVLVTGCALAPADGREQRQRADRAGFGADRCSVSAS